MSDLNSLETETDASVMGFERPFSAFVFISVWVAIFILSLSGNGLIFILMAKVKQMRTPVNYLILNKSISDFFFALSTTLFVFEVAAAGDVYGSLGCKFQVYLLEVFYGSSVLTLVGIGFERYYAVCQPMKFYTFKRKAKTIVIMTWVVPVILYSPLLWSCSAVKHAVQGYTCCNCYMSWPKWYYYSTYGLIMVVLLYLLPVITMTSCYIHVVRQLWSPNRLSQKTARMRNKQTKIITAMLSVVVLLFLFLWTPYTVLFVLKMFRIDISNSYSIVWYGSLMLAFLDSSCNPLIYIMCNKTYRRAIGNVFCGQSLFGGRVDEFKYESAISSVQKSYQRGTASISSDTQLGSTQIDTGSYISGTFLSEWASSL